MQYRIFKLSTTEEVIGEVEQEKTNFVWIKNPMKLLFLPNSKGRMTLNIFPYINPLISTQKTVVFNKRQIVAEIEQISDRIINQYEKTVINYFNSRLGYLDDPEPNEKIVNGMKISDEELHEALKEWDVEDETKQ